MSCAVVSFAFVAFSLDILLWGFSYSVPHRLYSFAIYLEDLLVVLRCYDLDDLS